MRKPEEVVSDYITACLEGDYDKVFTYISVEKRKRISPQMYYPKFLGIRTLETRLASLYSLGDGRSLRSLEKTLCYSLSEYIRRHTTYKTGETAYFPGGRARVTILTTIPNVTLVLMDAFNKVEEYIRNAENPHQGGETFGENDIRSRLDVELHYTINLEKYLGERYKIPSINTNGLFTLSLEKGYWCIVERDSDIRMWEPLPKNFIDRSSPPIKEFLERTNW